MPRRSREVDDFSRRGPTLSWPGRAWSPGSRGESPALRTVERFGAASGDGRLLFGDALDGALALARGGWEGKVKLVYVDPPFASQAAYTHEIRLDGPADGRVRRVQAYDDSWRGDEGDGIAAYLDMLAPRLEAMAALLAPTGTMWVHLDWRASYLVRVLLDEILGRKRFMNEIVWRRAPNLGRQAASGQFGRTLDTILVYGGPEARLVPPTRLEPIADGGIRWDDEGRPFTSAPRGDYTDASMDRLASEGRVHTSPSGKKYVKYFLEKDADGRLCRERRVDTLWTDVPPLRHAAVSERTGYPTQKPRALLDRIIRCATRAGDSVVDLFGGSGTTGESAHALGRRFVLGDASPVAINASRARLLRVGAAFTVESCEGNEAHAGEALDVHISRSGGTRGGEVVIDLRAPAEPLSWAVGAARADGEPFEAVWHSERTPGAVPVAATREARVFVDTLQATGSSSSVDLRVYGDDGSISAVRRPLPALDTSP